jgi:hypothetical protein
MVLQKLPQDTFVQKVQIFFKNPTQGDAKYQTKAVFILDTMQMSSTMGISAAPIDISD